MFIMGCFLFLPALGLYPNAAYAGDALPVLSPFYYTFSCSCNVSEAGSDITSSSPYWWVNSGGYMYVSAGRGTTVQGKLADIDPFRLLYSLNNPLDTDLGFHPQNIFRLVTRKNDWRNISQEAYFKITADNLSASPNRNESNGLLLFNRYVDSQNLYYAGVRRDGAAVIKKKQNGIYTTLAYAKGIFPGSYNHETSPNLLPLNTWVGLKTEVVTQSDGSVKIKLYMDKNWNLRWQLIAEATDANNPITSGGSGGIRTDFMDVIFDNYAIANIN
ncbi:MAG: hypothetical protein HY918_06130 [Candidatus Doudnabacteria bacterium]|nr:hypothetical protein [Candidatus Doudnabacteria bacterium]